MNQQELDHLKELADAGLKRIESDLERRRKEDPFGFALDLVGFARQIDAERAKKREGK